MKDRTIGVDLAKTVLELDDAEFDGSHLFRKTSSRGRIPRFMSLHPDAVVCCRSDGGPRKRSSWVA
jgi:hypothetical protein